MKFSLILVFLLSCNFLFAQVTEKEVVYFDYDKYELTTQAKESIDNLLERVGTRPVVHVAMIGHTDSDGNQVYNQVLSQKRAESVRLYLTANGMDVGQEPLELKAYGENSPVAANTDENGKQKNRRVEIVITLGDKVADAPSPKQKDGVQIFTFSPDKENRFVGKQGTFFHTLANSFVDANGNVVTKKVTFEVKEIYRKSDMILNNVTTTSDGKLLESAGMVHIKAYTEDGEVRIKKFNYFSIEFPSMKEAKDMNLFYGEQTTGEDEVNWKQAQQNAFADAFGEGYDTMAMDSAGLVFYENALEKYYFQSTKFGWINCDYFVPEKDNLVTMYVAEEEGMQYFLIFKSLNSVMSSTSSKKKVAGFKNIPSGAMVVVVGIKIKGKEAIFGSQTVRVKQSKLVKIKTTKVGIDELEELISQYN